MTSQEKIVRQAVDKLKDMLEDNDPNIKFLALHALTFLLESHPRIVAEHKEHLRVRGSRGLQHQYSL